MRNYTPYEIKQLEVQYRRGTRALLSMIIAITVLVFLLALTSCGSSKKTTSDSLNVTERDSMRKDYSFVHGNNIRLTDFVKTDIGLRFEWVTYDTSKPPGKDGKPPISGEGKGELSVNSNDSLAIVGNDSTKVLAAEKSGTERETDMQSFTERERDDTTLFSDVADMVTAIAVCVVVLFIVGFLKKRLSKS